jgi:hypothetical protein
MTDPIPFEAFVSHDLNADGSVETFAGKPIYIIESHGYQQQAHQITEVKVALRPSLDPPAALCTHTDPLINSDKGTISGLDQCVSDSKYGIVTTQHIVTIRNGTVEGNPEGIQRNSSNTPKGRVPRPWPWVNGNPPVGRQAKLVF